MGMLRGDEWVRTREDTEQGVGKGSDWYTRRDLEFENASTV